MSEATKQEATDNVPTAEPTEAAPEVTEDATPEPTEAAPEPTEAAPEVTEAAPEPTEAVLAESPSAATPEPTEAAPEVTEDATEPTMEKPCCVGVIRNADGLTGQTITEGDFPMYVNKPEGGNGIGVMVLHDIFGFEIPNCKYIVDYLASQGFTACMPNLYTGTGSWPATETEIEKPLEGDEFGSWFGKITSEEFWAGHFTKGVTASTGWLKTQGCSNLTTMGFCWGGKAVTVACKTDLFSAGVSLHGAAHSAADVRESKCPLFFCAINGDAFFPETVHEEIRALDTEVKVFPDMYHGFVVRGDFENAPAVKAAAEEALADTCAFFTKHCAAPAPLEKKKSLLNTLTFGLLDDDDDEKKSEKKVEKKKSFMDTLFGGDKEKEVATPAIEEAPAGDVKDTEEHTYEQYLELPQFTPEHKSLMSKHLTPELFEKLKDVKTSKGYTLSNAIQTGVKTPHLGVGITAGDEESWEAFKEIMYPIIKGWHGYDPEVDTHKVDLDASKLVFSPETLAMFDSYVVSTRIRAARNVSGFALPAGALSEDRAGVEKVLIEAFDKFEGELKGTYYPLGSLTEEQTDFLLTKGFLFQRPKETNLLWHAGAARSWPDNRGIYHNEERTALCWVNEEDHCRIISMADGGDVKSVFARFSTISNSLKEAAENNDTKLMFSDKLGFLGTCPSNLGTGLRGSVMIKLPKLNEDPEFLELVCGKFNLQPRGSAGEHSAAEGAKWDISNKQRIGFSEVELVQKMIDGVTLIIRIEEILAEGSKTKEEITKMLDNPEDLLAVQDVELQQAETDVSPGGTAKQGCCTIA